MTPNVTHPQDSALAACESGADGIAAINTILSVVGIDPKTLKPQPTVAGSTVPGGYSGQAVRPIALRHVMEIAKAIPKNRTISGMGGIETGWDAAQFMLLGSHTVQVCTGAMLNGYGMIEGLCEELLKFTVDHNFERLVDCVGHSLPHFSTHAKLVEAQRQAKLDRKSGADNNWKGDIAKETSDLTATD